MPSTGRSCPSSAIVAGHRSIDEKPEGHVPFDSCLAVGWQAQLLLVARLVAKLRGGKSLVFIIYRTQEAGVGFPISLTGFGPAVYALR